MTDEHPFPDDPDFDFDLDLYEDELNAPAPALLAQSLAEHVCSRPGVATFRLSEMNERQLRITVAAPDGMVTVVLDKHFVMDLERLLGSISMRMRSGPGDGGR